MLVTFTACPKGKPALFFWSPCNFKVYYMYTNHRNCAHSDNQILCWDLNMLVVCSLSSQQCILKEDFYPALNNYCSAFVPFRSTSKHYTGTTCIHASHPSLFSPHVPLCITIHWVNKALSTLDHLLLLQDLFCHLLFLSLTLTISHWFPPWWMN